MWLRWSSGPARHHSEVTWDRGRGPETASACCIAVSKPLVSSRSKHYSCLNSISFRFCLLIVCTERIKTKWITAGLSREVKIYLLRVQGQLYFLRTEEHTVSGAVLKEFILVAMNQEQRKEEITEHFLLWLEKKKKRILRNPQLRPTPSDASLAGKGSQEVLSHQEQIHPNCQHLWCPIQGWASFLWPPTASHSLSVHCGVLDTGTKNNSSIEAYASVISNKTNDQIIYTCTYTYPLIFHDPYIHTYEVDGSP